MRSGPGSRVGVRASGWGSCALRLRLARLLDGWNDEGRAALRALALHPHVRFVALQQVALRAKKLKSHGMAPTGITAPYLFVAFCGRTVNAGGNRAGISRVFTPRPTRWAAAFTRHSPGGSSHRTATSTRILEFSCKALPAAVNCRRVAALYSRGADC